MYIHESRQWPNFTWDQTRVTDLLADTSHLQGRLLGRMEKLSFELREEAALQSLTQDVLKTCEIGCLVIMKSFRIKLVDVAISSHQLHIKNSWTNSVKRSLSASAIQ